jgi:hypothetical protein
MKAKSRDYIVGWNWREDENHEPMRTDEIRATTAPRAINKLKKELAEEYDFSANDLVIHEVRLAK